MTVATLAEALSIPSALLGVYRPAAPLFVEGRGCTLIDDDGKEYLDFTSGIGVNAFGYGDAGIAEALSTALATGVIHTSNLFRTAPAARLAEALVERSFADQVFFCNSGGEANEGGIKFARRWARTQGGGAKHEVVALRGSFHGRLFGSLAVTDRLSFQTPFLPLMPGARFVDASDLGAIESAVSAEKTAAIIAEPVQGEGGIQPLSAATLDALRQIADSANALLIFDEVQCGLGRTGRLFAYESAGVTPDILTLAKPLAGGLPMGAVLVSEKVGKTIQPGDHATTFGGGPLVSSVALHVVQRISEPAFLQRVRQLGERVRETVASWTAATSLREARGVGLMWGIELSVPAAPVVARALDAGLLVLTAGERVLRLLPPLTIGEDELDRGLGILREVL
jgi:predicted acetylornithine/succinylornithine family transaminase